MRFRYGEDVYEIAETAPTTEDFLVVRLPDGTKVLLTFNQGTIVKTSEITSLKAGTKVYRATAAT